MIFGTLHANIRGPMTLKHNGQCAKYMSGFKPGSALSDPGRGQPMSLGPLIWSINVFRWIGTLSEDRLSVSNISTQSTVWTTDVQDSPIMTSTWVPPGLSAEPYGRPPSMHPLQVMHNHLEFIDRPWQPSVYMMAYQYSYASHSWTDSVWSHRIGSTYGSSPLAACTHLHNILGWTLVPVITQPCYINRSSNIHPGTYMT